MLSHMGIYPPAKWLLQAVSYENNSMFYSTSCEGVYLLFIFQTPKSDCEASSESLRWRESLVWRSWENSSIKRCSLMCFHCERLCDCISLSNELDFFFAVAIFQTVADGKWSHQHATHTTTTAWACAWCILRRDVAIIGPNGNRCCVPWDMASLAQHAGCQAFGSHETSCCFSSPPFLRIRNNLLGTNVVDNNPTH